mgnify:FL=1
MRSSVRADFSIKFTRDGQEGILSNMDTDQNLTKKERKELKREMKAGEMEISLRRTRTKKIAIWVIGCVVVVAGAAGIFVVAKKQPQQGLSEDHSKEYANQGQDHIAVGDSLLSLIKNAKKV